MHNPPAFAATPRSVVRQHARVPGRAQRESARQAAKCQLDARAAPEQLSPARSSEKISLRENGRQPPPREDLRLSAPQAAPQYAMFPCRQAVRTTALATRVATCSVPPAKAPPPHPARLSRCHQAQSAPVCAPPPP